jgi:hypothetical protein
MGDRRRRKCTRCQFFGWTVESWAEQMPAAAPTAPKPKLLPGAPKQINPRPARSMYGRRVASHFFEETESIPDRVEPDALADLGITGRYESDES